MPTISATPQRRDTVRRYRFEVKDGFDVVVPFSGSEPLSARISAAPDGPVLASPATAWFDAAEGLFDVVVAPADLEALLPATYAIAVNVGAVPQEAFTGTITIGAAPFPPSVSGVGAIDEAAFGEIAARLAATGAFQGVYSEKTLMWPIDEIPAALVEDMGIAAQEPIAVGIDRRTVHYMVTVYTPENPADEATSAAYLRAAEEAARLALDRKRFAGVTDPAWTRLRSWNRTPRGQRPKLGDQEQRRSMAEGTFGYLVATGDTTGGGGGGGGPTVPVPEPVAVAGYGTTGYGSAGYGI